MRYGGLDQNSGAATIEEVRIGVKEIPYDYVATFKLSGKRGERVQDVITISTEGTFVAVSVGYSFVPAKDALTVSPVLAPLKDTFAAMFPAASSTTPATPAIPPDQLAFRTLAEGALLKAAGIQFLYTIVDSGSGRELQNKAVHSVAGLGSADGDRPFRPFARPVQFVPRATIRIEVEEISVGPLFTGGTLFIVLHGYKRLGE